MADLTSDAGTPRALLDRLVKVRLPQTTGIRQRVERDQRPSGIDIAFLKEVLAHADTAQRYVVRNPAFPTVASGLVEVDGEIVRKAVDKERGA